MPTQKEVLFAARKAIDEALKELEQEHTKQAIDAKKQTEKIEAIIRNRLNYFGINYLKLLNLESCGENFSGVIVKFEATVKIDNLKQL